MFITIDRNLHEAIADCSRAIAILEKLVEKEGRRELRSNLWLSLYNRAIARSVKKEWKEASADIEKGGGMLRELIGEGKRHVIGSFIHTAGFLCRNAKELGGVKKASERGNDAMRWIIEEIEGDRANEVLVRAAVGFADDVRANAEVLLENGLDEKVMERFLKIIKDGGI